MAGSFGCDPIAAGEAAKALAEIRTDMDSLGKVIDDSGGATGSARVESALQDFFHDTSDNRDRMDKLLERASGLLKALSEGTLAVDADLSKALGPDQVSPAPGQSVPRSGVRAQ